jgi:hypothetical protein
MLPSIVVGDSVVPSALRLPAFVYTVFTRLVSIAEYTACFHAVPSRHGFYPLHLPVGFFDLIIRTIPGPSLLFVPFLIRKIAALALYRTAFTGTISISGYRFARCPLLR